MCWPEGLGADTDSEHQVLQHHPGADGRQAGGLCSWADKEGGERNQSVLINIIIIILFNATCVVVCTHSACVLALQADEARKYGARVYCVGIKDFDEQQVRELKDGILKKTKKHEISHFPT